MNDETEELTMAQTCRVYAASGMSMTFEPEHLMRLARALEAAQAVSDEIEGVQDEIRSVMRLVRMSRCLAAFGAVALGVAVAMMAAGLL